MIIFHFLAHPRKKEKKREEIETTNKKAKNLLPIHRPWPRIRGGRNLLAQSWVEINPFSLLKKERSFELPIFPSFDVSNRVVNEEQTEKTH